MPDHDCPIVHVLYYTFPIYIKASMECGSERSFCALSITTGEGRGTHLPRFETFLRIVGTEDFDREARFALGIIQLLIDRGIGKCVLKKLEKYLRYLFISSIESRGRIKVIGRRSFCYRDFNKCRILVIDF